MKVIIMIVSLALPALGDELRVLSFNVRHATGMDGAVALERQAEIINNSKAQVIGLQEIDKSCRRSGNIDQAVAFAAQTSSSAHFAAFMKFDGGEYGMAMLSKLPADNVRAAELPAGREPRVAIVLEVETASKHRVLVANVHFDWTDEKLRIPQAKALIAHLDKQPLPAIVLGDYNAEPDSPTLQLFRDAGFRFMAKPEGESFTWNAKNPTAEIDHVAIRDGAAITLTGQDIRVLGEPEASDHRPVLARIRVTAATAPPQKESPASPVDPLSD